MLVTLTVAKYKGSKSIFGVMSMAVMQFILFFGKGQIKFSKLMGSGKNGTFDIRPDLGQWAYLWVWENEQDFQKFFEKSILFKYIKRLSSEYFTLHLEPMQSHGLWDKKQPFGKELKGQFSENQPIVVLTRATIKPSKAADFWENVPTIAQNFAQNEGFIYSIGIGEIPFLKQATLSVWKDESSMKEFAYRKKHHSEVIKKTRTQEWYSEELFARFKLVSIEGQAPESILKLQL